MSEAEIGRATDGNEATCKADTGIVKGTTFVKIATRARITE